MSEHIPIAVPPIIAALTADPTFARELATALRENFGASLALQNAIRDADTAQVMRAMEDVAEGRVVEMAYVALWSDRRNAGDRAPVPPCNPAELEDWLECYRARVKTAVTEHARELANLLDTHGATNPRLSFNGPAVELLIDPAPGADYCNGYTLQDEIPSLLQTHVLVRLGVAVEPGIRALATALAAVQERAEALGLFIDDRELLSCPNCKLTEDILTSGQLYTYYPTDSQIDSHARQMGTDTGLRFSKIAEGRFTCPGCGNEVQLTDSEPPC